MSRQRSDSLFPRRNSLGTCFSFWRIFFIQYNDQISLALKNDAFGFDQVINNPDWIGGVPVDVRQAGTGGLPREGLHHGQQQEK